MTDEEKRKIIEAMEDERMEAEFRDKGRQQLRLQMDLAVTLHAYYQALLKAGFDDCKAFSLVLQRQALIIDYAMTRQPKPK